MFLGTIEVIGNMPMPAPRASRTNPWGFGASLGFHIAIGLALLLVVAPRPQSPPSEDTVTVDVLTQQQFEAEKAPPAMDAPSKQPGDLPATPSVEANKPEFTRLQKDQPAIAAGAMVKATHLMSATVLADPRSAKARKAMQGLASSERIVQLCNIEAMEQIHIWKPTLRPDFLVAYAMADTELSGQQLKADGGAFRSRGSWYNIGFTCTVTPDLKQVAAFAFLVGDKIPRSEWKDHNLLADDGSAD